MRPPDGRVRHPILGDRDWLWREYVERRRSTVSIAAELGACKATIARALARHGIEKRPPGRHSHGCRRHPLYAVWAGVRRRCTDPNSRSWPLYGGRGVRMCDRWLDIRLFIADLSPSYRPGCQLHRIDNDGHYEPGNTEWLTQEEHMRVHSTDRIRQLEDALRKAGIPIPPFKAARDAGVLDEAA